MSELKTARAAERTTISREDALRGKRAYWFFRRAQDVFFSALAIVALMPLMLAVALLVVLDSPGAGPIFTQTRVGRDGRHFRLYKFRTMVPDAEARLKDLLKYNEMSGPAFKIKHDPRITRIGRFLRKSGIDELPQLFNVLRGDMSIVGRARRFRARWRSMTTMPGSASTSPPASPVTGRFSPGATR